MSKVKNFFAILLTVGALALLAPRFLPLEKISARIGQELLLDLPAPVTIGTLDWRWLPLPLVRLQQVTAINEELEFDCPEIVLYPDWHALLAWQIKLGKVVLLAPRVTLKGLPPLAASTAALPQLQLVIKNGQIHTQLPETSTALVKDSLQLTALNGLLSSTPEGVKMQLTATTPFSPHLEALGRYTPEQGEFRLDLNGRDCNLAQLLTPMLGGKIELAPSPVTMQAHLEGRGKEEFTLLVNGQFPTLNLPGPIPSQIAAQSFGGLELKRSKESLALTVKDLALREPALLLKSRVVRNAPARPEEAPIWDLDFEAHQLDLSGIRQKVLALWGDDPIAKEVCAIVLGGQAKQANFSFQGPAADLAHLGAMKIGVDVVKAPIHIPGINLALDEASGPITIIGGNLAGHGLSAKINQSQGSNCELFLHLPNDGDGFRLGLDLDVALPDLNRVLNQVVNHPGFHKELQHFHDFTGRAQGHLTLGDTLSKIKTTVSVQAMQGQGRYDRLPWPLTVHGGSLEISPQHASWKGLQAELESQTIETSSGSVTWAEGIELAIDQLRADLDSDSLYRFGSLQFDHELFTLSEFLGNRLTDLDGRIHLDNLTLHGPALTPAEWQYEAKFQAQNLHWRIPQLPEAAIADTLAGTLGQSSAALAGTMRFQEQPLAISGNYTHRALHDWRGWTEISGTVQPKLAAMIENWQLVPPAFFPRIPCTLDKFRFEPGPEPERKLKVSGRLLAGAGEPEAARVDIDLNPLAPASNLRLNFTSGAEEGELKSGRLPNNPEQTLTSWKGTLSADTLNALFAHSPIRSGQLNGNTSLLRTQGQPAATTYSGFLAGTELSWEGEEEELPIRITTLRATGLDQQLRIGELALGLGSDEVSAKGTVNATPQGVQLDLALTSPTLDTDTINRFLSTVRGRLRKAGLEPEPPNGDDLWHQLSGTLAFKIRQLHYTHHRKITKPTDEPTVNYTWSPFEGKLQLLGQQKMTIQLDNSELCGLAMTGTWHSDPQLGSSTIAVSPAEDYPLFETLLPCLGVKQHLIAGEFDLNANFVGEVGNWRSGTLNLESPKGKIWRMNFLSKVLSVVNFTELFSLDALPNLMSQGLAYTDLDIRTHIADNKIIIDKGVLKGEGLNMTGQGTIDLADLTADLTIFIAPFKTIDTIVGKVPILNKVVGGKKGAILTVPVGVQGPLADPEVTTLPPSAVGRSALELLKETLSLPFTLFSPLFPSKE